MRILPIAFYLRAKEVSSDTNSMEYFECVHDVSRLTHGHERSLMSCGIYVAIADALLDGNSLVDSIKVGVEKALCFYQNQENYMEDFAHFTVIDIHSLQSKTIDQIGSTGYVVDTLEAALYCLIKTNSYRECMLMAVNLGGDTDTNAGGLAGLYYGYDSIPSSWIEKLARQTEFFEACNTFKENHM